MDSGMRRPGGNFHKDLENPQGYPHKPYIIRIRNRSPCWIFFC